MDFEKWHDGIGYDIDAIKLASTAERAAIEQMLINHTPRDWRDIEALAEINTKRAREVFKQAINGSDPDVRVAVTRYASGLVSNRADVAVLFAAMLFYIFGKADEPFDMAQRPFFLRFNTEDRAEREAVFLSLCKALGINPEKYLLKKA